MLALLYLMTALGLAFTPTLPEPTNPTDDPVEEFLTWVRGDAHTPAGITAPPIDPATLVRTAPGYRYTGDFWPQIAAHVQRMPGRVKPERIGTTLGGRPIWAFHIQNPGEPIDRKVLVFAGIHALEWISTEVAVDLLDELATQGPHRGSRVTIIPLLNPDGRIKAEQDLRDGEQRYRRGNQINVDLNRDFAVNREATAFWRHILPGYFATSKGSLSQPESRALDALAARERYHRSASLHAFGGFFYYPWSGRFSRPQRHDRREFVQLGRAMESAGSTRAYRTRQLGRWGFFFRAHGSEIDHLYGRYGTRAFLIEITRSGLRPLHFWKSKANPFRWYNPEIPRRMQKHKDRTVHSLRALITAPELPSERAARLRDEHLAPPIVGDEAP